MLSGKGIFIDFRYIEKARVTVKSCEVIEQNSIYNQLKELIKNMCKEIAVEADKMAISELDSYKKSLVNMNLILR